MKKRTKKNMKYQFSKRTIQIITERDRGCIFCRMGFHMKNQDQVLYQLMDIMHYINKSQGGLGVPENGAVGCRYHHGLLDNGNKGLREEMKEIFRSYLMQQYPDWKKEKLIYDKWNFLNFG